MLEVAGLHIYRVAAILDFDNQSLLLKMIFFTPSCSRTPKQELVPHLFTSYHAHNTNGRTHKLIDAWMDRRYCQFPSSLHNVGQLKEMHPLKEYISSATFSASVLGQNFLIFSKGVSTQNKLCIHLSYYHTNI